jgi:hypothetical protein
MAGADDIKIVPGDGRSFDQFGGAVAIDGEYAIVGAAYSNRGGKWSGAAYVFKWDGLHWREQAELGPTEAGEMDRFGYAVAISGDYAMVGAPFAEGKGTVYIFHRDGEQWGQQAKLVSQTEGFGWAVSLCGDEAAIGSFARQVGAISFYRRSDTTWRENGSYFGLNGFGYAVAIHDGWALAGAHSDGSGTVTTFQRINGGWAFRGKLTEPDAQPNSLFGYAVSLADGYAIVGAYNQNKGSAHIFAHTPKGWQAQAVLQPADGEVELNFGVSVSMTVGYAAVGTGNEAAYIFEQQGEAWIPTRIQNSAKGFGGAVAITAPRSHRYQRALIGASYDDGPNGRLSGATFIVDMTPQSARRLSAR